MVDRLAPAPAPVTERIRFVADRSGHDQRYALDTRRIRDTLGWQPRIGLDDGLEAAMRCGLDHPGFARFLPASK